MKQSFRDLRAVRDLLRSWTRSGTLEQRQLERISIGLKQAEHAMKVKDWSLLSKAFRTIVRELTK